MKKTHVFLVAAVAVMLCAPASFVYSAPCSDNLTYDDGVAENGYGFTSLAGNPSAMCQRFKPCSFPYKFSKFSIGLTCTGSPTDWTFEIVMWKNEGGAPGAVIDNVTVTASAVPVWTTVTMYDFTLPRTWATVAATETDNSSVFIGIRYDPTPTGGTVYVGSDESPTTPLWPTYATEAAGPWEPATFYWSNCRAFLMRAKGSNCIDNDGDGYGDNCTLGPDCNDNDATIHALVTYYRDADGDGFGNADNASQVCSLTPPAGYVANSTDVDDTDPFYTDILPACTVKIIPKVLGWLIGDKEKTKSLLVIGQKGVEFGDNPVIKWESESITTLSQHVFFKRFMFIRTKFNGEPLDKQDYRVLIGDCVGKITWAK